MERERTARGALRFRMLDATGGSPQPVESMAPEWWMGREGMRELCDFGNANTRSFGILKAPNGVSNP